MPFTGAHLKQVPQPARSMYIADDFHAAAQLAIQDEIAPDRPGAHAIGNIWAFDAQMRISGKQPALSVERVEQPVRRIRIIQSDIGPDADQVFFRLRGTDERPGRQI